jgi:hypothetical protein
MDHKANKEYVGSKKSAKTIKPEKNKRSFFVGK